VAERILCLPIHNGMGEADVQRVLDSLAAIDPGEQVALAEVS